ncbi:MAG: ATP-binding protein [Anaerolineales bacterium]|jgi:hypothetical protein|nr:ATP-binding protein [Anaerolineales bacterium]
MAASSSTDLGFSHLLAELSRIDLLIRRQVQRWQAAGQNPEDAFRGLYISDSEASALLERPMGSNWGATVQLPDAIEQRYAQALQEAQERSDQLAAQAQAQGEPLRLQRLVETLGLDAFDRDAFLICSMGCLDLRYERLFGYLQDDVTRKRPGVNLILDLLCPPGVDRLHYLPRFSEDHPLGYWGLLEHSVEAGRSGALLSQNLQADESVIAWLLGQYRPAAEMSGVVKLRQPDAGLETQPEDHHVDELNEQLRMVYGVGQPPVIAFYGLDQTGQEMAALRFAALWQRPFLQIQVQALTSSGDEEKLSAQAGTHLLRLALRDARLQDAIPFLSGWDVCLSDGLAHPAWLAEVMAFPGLIILSGRSGWRSGGVDGPRHVLWVNFPMPAYPQRRALWAHYLQQALPSGQVTAAALDAWQVDSLAGQFALSTSQIRDAVGFAHDRAVQQGAELHSSDLFAAARLYSNPRLSSLANKIVPRFSWLDIILPGDQIAMLRELVNTVRMRPRVLDEWGVGKKLVASRGITALFAGPPGTGKTMAAEVIASELGLDLYKIDLSTVISKYIGETEKNLERIFNEAEASNAILFFDEADALFGKRSEVRDSHDRYANIEISYLLQRMEAYDGVTILATNLRANLDEAFTRRLQFAVDYPFPEEADRLRIWETLFPRDVPRGNDVDFRLLARRFKLAGGNIRNILVNAAYLAASDQGVVNMAHLLHGTRRELQKMGRLVGETEMMLE